MIGSVAGIAFALAVGALYRTSNMQAEVVRKVDLMVRSALGVLKADSEENAQILKRMSDRILALERKIDQSQHSSANKQAEITKLRAENERLRAGKAGGVRPKPGPKLKPRAR